MATVIDGHISVKMGYGSCIGSSSMALLVQFKRIDPSRFTSHLISEKEKNIKIISWNQSSESAKQVFIDGSVLLVKCDIQVWVPRSIMPSRSEVKSLGDRGAIWLFSWWLENQRWYPKK